MARLFLVLLFVVLPGTLAAQIYALLPGFKAELVELNSKPDSIATDCGEFFRYIPALDEKNGVGVVLFSYIRESGKRAFLTMGSDKIVVHAFRGAVPRKPQLKVLRSGGEVYPWVEVSVNKDDFVHAPCLKHSQVLYK